MSDASDSKLDPRVNCYRDDLAASYLEGKISARRFVAGYRAQVVRCGTALRRAPSPKSPQDSQLLAGETVQIYDEANGYAWIQSETDGYVGYADSNAFSRTIVEVTHCQRVLRSFVYPEPNIKTPPIMATSMAAQVSVTERTERFSRIASGGWVFSDHFMEIDTHEPDFVETALKFVGTPYLWGGRGSLGIDCSGLVQITLIRSGLACPRDTYMQATAVGMEIPGEDDQYPMRRGDLIYWPDHVAIVLDQGNVVHASGHHMFVTVEPWRDIDLRVRTETGGQSITHLRRLPQSSG